MNLAVGLPPIIIHHPNVPVAVRFIVLLKLFFIKLFLVILTDVVHFVEFFETRFGCFDHSIALVDGDVVYFFLASGVVSRPVEHEFFVLLGLLLLHVNVDARLVLAQLQTHNGVVLRLRGDS